MGKEAKQSGFYRRQTHTHTWANTDRNENKPQMSDGRN